MDPLPKYAAWALEQISSRTVSDELVQPKLQALIDALRGLQGDVGVQVFGLSASLIEPEGKERVRAQILAALVAWKAHFQTQKNAVALQELDKVAKAHGIPELKSTGRAALRCDPLGTRDGLAPEWVARLRALDEAIAGKRALDPGAIQLVGADEEETPTVAWRRPDLATLHEFALRHEAEAGATFPRELAAFWATADGVLVDDEPVLRPVEDWEWDFDDRGLCVGCGGYVQGSLILTNPKPGQSLAEVEVIDVDDDGEERARYASFGAFVDAMLRLGQR